MKLSHNWAVLLMVAVTLLAGVGLFQLTIACVLARDMRLCNQGA